MSEKLFTPEDIPAEFWRPIEVARQDQSRFRELLKQMNRGALIRFAWEYQRAAAQLKVPVFLRHVDPELSEDGIYELAMWVVGQGKDYYTDIFDHPEKMPPRVGDDTSALGYYSDAVLEYRRRYNEPIPSRD